MEIFSMILSLLSGVAMFLFGMILMGDGLKMVAGNKLEKFLYKMTNTPIKGLALGAGVTCVIQSSSATTVMVIGFVNSMMMKLRQAISIIMGANIGTSITGWILCLSYIQGSGGWATILSTATISAIMAVVGIVLRMFGKRSVYRNAGNIMLGFSILMMGMQTMSGAVEPLRENEFFVSMLTMFSNPLMGILVGIVFTAILQSASAAVGVLQALSVTGILTFASAFPIVLGIGVGAACPVLISAIGANKNGKRTALIYLMNDLFGMIFWGIVFYAVNGVLHFSFMDQIMTPVLVALTNTVFRVATVCVLFPFIPRLEKLVCMLVKDTQEEMEEEADLELLEDRLVSYPALAMGQCQRVISGMSERVQKNVNRAMDLLNDFQQECFEKVQRTEDLTDKYETKLGAYLMRLTKKEMTTAQSRQMSLYLSTISDFERIGDHAAFIAYMSNEMQESRMSFSKEALDELNVVMEAVREIMNITARAFREGNQDDANKVSPLGVVITNLCDELKHNHVIRLGSGDCGLEQGTIFNDILNSFTRIAAHCASITSAMQKASEGDEDIHIHDSRVYAGEGMTYYSYYTNYSEKYDLQNKSSHVKRMGAEAVK
ncbi:Na/Pi cotransporter family protein [Mediterraneibacter glycyrrhizinilyticus]|uniref:Na/Pi cotransporter family protein n=1 Tax=Mediterraneibacter glycyrrhizinilyticus TaxID=342942 RepID=UPI0019605A05|nr:Na/Pi cotransporter family protein [Mediterraneibacter glycyrrhizinilyticus]MBM6751795.1 Na/Pi cotransporter family protein [Mediterraneibacter glycyrrhizinilyticus]